MGREWIKLYVKGWLNRSMSWELTDAQKGIWAGFLALAGDYYKDGKEPGFIPLSPDAIQRALKSNKRNFERAFQRLLETERVKVVEGGVLVINFGPHNPSRQQIYEERFPEARAKRILQNPTQSHANLHKPTQTHTEGEGETEREYFLEGIKNSTWYPSFKEDFPQFTDSDLAAALEWIEAHPKQRPKLIKRFLINWARKIPDRASETPVERYETLEELEARERRQDANEN